MKTTVKKISDTRVELKVVLDAKDLKDARAKAVERLAKDVKIAGFRKGKVPADMAEKAIDPNLLAETTVDIAVRTTVPVAFTESKVQALAMPNINVTKYVPDQSAEYTATADVLPEIKLGAFKGLKVKKPEVTVADKDVKEILDNIANSFAEKKVVKRAAKLGDEVIIDFVGKKDDKPFEGGSAKDYNLALGSKQFIPGFEEGIVGHESGDKFDLPLTFSKDYPAKELAGAKTVFEVLVKQVNEVVKPKIDDELAKKCGEFKTLTALKTDIKKNLKAQNEHRVMDKYKDDLVNALVKKSTVSAPEILIEDQFRFIKDDMARNAASRGMTFEDFLKQAHKTEEEWTKEAKEVAEARVKASLVLQTLALQEKITVSEKDVDAKVAELRDVYQKSAEALENLKQPEVRQDIKNRMTIDKTIDFLVKANK